MPDELKRSEKENSENPEKAKRADLITFSKNIDCGVRCQNCMYVDVPNKWCLHKLVDQELKDGPERMCCSYWDGVGTIRAWEEEPRTIEQRDKYIKKEGSTMQRNLIEDFQKVAKELNRDANSVNEFKMWLEAEEENDNISPEVLKKHEKYFKIPDYKYLITNIEEDEEDFSEKSPEEILQVLADNWLADSTLSDGEIIKRWRKIKKLFPEFSEFADGEIDNIRAHQEEF